MMNFLKDELFFFRIAGFIISALIVFALNLNWIFQRPFSLLGGSAFLLVLFLLAYLFQERKKNSATMKKAAIMRGFLFGLFSLGLVLVLGYANFNLRFDEPRYVTPDPAVHYLYMSQTSDTGILPAFLPSRVYPDSGYMEAFAVQHSTYMPGVLVAYFFLSKVLYFVDKVSLLQIFNILCVGMLSGYLFSLVRKKEILKNKFFLVAGFLAIFFGAFLTFLLTSFTSQLFGLFLLIFFADSLEEYFNGGTSFFVPALAFSALIISYFYWLPLAALFVLVSILLGPRKSWYENFQRSALAFSVSSVLSVGYLILAYKNNIVGFASNDGGFNFQELFLSDLVLAAPVAFLGFLYLAKNRLRHPQKNIFISLLLSSAFYSLVLTLAFWADKVSHYTMLKNLYLLITLAWISAFSYLEYLYDFFRKNKLRLRSYIFRLMPLTVGYLAVSAVYFLAPSLSAEPFPLEANNIKKILAEKTPQISREQMGLLDDMERNHPEALSDGKILTIAPYDTAFWSYAYSGIWPRTFSLLAEGENKNNIFSPMSVYSLGIADYGRWITHDKKHYLIYLDTSESQGWSRRSGFEEEDYEKIISFGNNRLLRLIPGNQTGFYLQRQKNYFEESPKENIRLPFEEEFRPRRDNLSGMAFQINLSRKKLAGNYNFSLKEGQCSENGQIILERNMTKEELSKFEDGDYLEFRTEKPIENSMGKDYCFIFSSSEGKDAFHLVRSDGRVIYREHYTYEN